jgi:quaternary ammonium compound-resistance protein SugE
MHDDATIRHLVTGVHMTWVLLFAAAALETVWAIALKRSDGFTVLGPTAVFAVAAPASLGLLSLALRDLPVGTAYALWTGTGAVGAALAGIVLLGEQASAMRLAPIVLVAAGVAWLALGEA